MTQEEAIAALKRMCAWDKTPTLSELDLQQIIVESKSLDRAGVQIDEDAYEETYDLNLAAQRAWQMKAGNTAHIVNFSSDGERWDTGSVMKHCLRMADEYGRRRTMAFTQDENGLTNGLYPWQIANMRELEP